MGSGSSRLGEHQPKAAGVKRRLSTFICGSSSSRATTEAEDYPVEPLANSAGCGHSVPSNSLALPMESVLSSSGSIGFTSPESEQGSLSESSTLSSEGLLFENTQNNVEPASKRKQYTEDNESVPAHHLNEEGRSSQSRHGVEGPSDAETGIIDLSSVVSPAVSSSNIGSQPLEHDSVQEVAPSGLGLIVSDRIQGSTEGNVVDANIMNISSGNFSGSNNETSTREARRNSRRMFWDAFSSRRSRRHTDFPTILFATDDADSIGSRWSWLLDFGSDNFNDGTSNDLWPWGRRSHFTGGRRRHSRSQFWGRLRGGTSERGRRTICRSGLHPDGPCLCGLEDEASSQTSMSRIVMLAEALFEVLDELHRQPTSFELSTFSNPAPESTIDSLPIKSYEKSTAIESGNEVEKCYICLEEYKTGDKIRVLPCTHRYHTTCVDKWLKEIHGVCPLCRGDVRQGKPEGSLQESDSSAVPLDLA